MKYMGNSRVQRDFCVTGGFPVSIYDVIIAFRYIVSALSNILYNSYHLVHTLNGEYIF